jgi:alkylhydroperoxidase family enzyme
MLRVSKVPFEQVDPDLQQTMLMSDEALGGSEWIQVFAQTPQMYKDFVAFYYKHIMNDTDGISVKLTELVRHKVAQINECSL